MMTVRSLGPVVGLLATVFESALAAGEVPIEFQLPLDCEISTTCFVQNLVDHDPGPAAMDYMCGQLTYDGHGGTDFRVPDLRIARPVNVLAAAAAGRVSRTRDGVADVSVRQASGATVRDRECGNGLVIDHGRGWETQYCHLAKGSQSAKPGTWFRPSARRQANAVQGKFYGPLPPPPSCPTQPVSFSTRGSRAEGSAGLK
jgi:hypothetical protein